MDRQSQEFEYNYSAPTAEERKMIEAIRREYVPEDERRDMTVLRRLDRKVKGVPKAAAISLGICGLLVFGLGMSMIMAWELMYQGVAVCVLGAMLMAVCAPLHHVLLSIYKRKYGEKIIHLSDELLGTRSESRETAN